MLLYLALECVLVLAREFRCPNASNKMTILPDTLLIFAPCSCSLFPAEEGQGRLSTNSHWGLGEFQHHAVLPRHLPIVTSWHRYYSSYVRRQKTHLREWVFPKVLAREARGGIPTQASLMSEPTFPMLCSPVPLTNTMAWHNTCSKMHGPHWPPAASARRQWLHSWGCLFRVVMFLIITMNAEFMNTKPFLIDKIEG